MMASPRRKKIVPGVARMFAGSTKRAYNTPALHRMDSLVMDRHAFLKSVPLFIGLQRAELESLEKQLTSRRFAPGAAIFFQGDDGQILYLIESGQVRIYVQDEDGQETSVVLYRSGDIFGELAIIDGLPRSASAVAMEETVVLMWSRERFSAQMRGSPQLALNFMRALSKRLRSSTRHVSTLTFLGVNGRLARKLLELAQEHGVAEAQGVRLNITLTQTALASLVGATRESINKALSSFKRKGLIEMEQGGIIIVDPDGLRAIGS
jgi:CRP-like cAMP-binding protein